MDVDKVDCNNYTALHHAAYENRPACISILLQHAADPNIASKSFGDTPLMLAAYQGHLDSMTLVLQDGHCNLEM